MSAPGTKAILVGALGQIAPNGKHVATPRSEGRGGGGFLGARGGEFSGTGGGGGLTGGSPRATVGVPLWSQRRTGAAFCGGGIICGMPGGHVNVSDGGPPGGVSGGLPAESPGGCLVLDDLLGGFGIPRSASGSVLQLRECRSRQPDDPQTDLRPLLCSHNQFQCK